MLKLNPEENFISFQMYKVRGDKDDIKKYNVRLFFRYEKKKTSL